MTTQIDTEALRVRYLAERDKRLRADGNEQYVEPTGKFADYLEDPYVRPEPASRCSTRSPWRSSAVASPASLPGRG